MGATQSIIEGEELHILGPNDRKDHTVDEINKLIGNTVFQSFDYSKEYYKAYTDIEKLKRMREDYEKNLALASRGCAWKNKNNNGNNN